MVRASTGAASALVRCSAPHGALHRDGGPRPRTPSCRSPCWRLRSPARTPGLCSSISSAASRSARPLASNNSALTISPLRFSTSRLSAVAQFRLLARFLLRQLRIRIGFDAVCLRSAFVALRGISRSDCRDRPAAWCALLILRLENSSRLAHASSRSSVYGEVLIRGQPCVLRLLHHLRQNFLPATICFQQPIPILGECGGVQHPLVQIQTNKPAEQQCCN